VDSIFGLQIYADVQAGTKSHLAVFTFVSTWNVHNKARSFSEIIQSPNRFAKCRKMERGDTFFELHPTFGDMLDEYSFIFVVSVQKSCFWRRDKTALCYTEESCYGQRTRTSSLINF
jgi:hypothetical protein